MKALCWFGTNDVRVEEVPDPKILDARDAIIKITSTAICGSDLHLVDGYMPQMEKGDILGHEPMGEVVEVGSAVKNLKAGDRVVVPFTISCGECFFCQKGLYSCCDNSNPNAEMARQVMGHSPTGIFGYSHLTGGFAGGQAEYLRVPFADVGPLKVPEGLPDEKVLFLSDVYPTGYMAAENADIEPGDTVAVWGCGPVGQFALKSCRMLGAERLIAIDNVTERLEMAERESGAETINFDKVDVYEQLLEMTGGRGPDRCIDAVGCEALAGGTVDGIVDAVKTATLTATDRTHVLRQAIWSCRKGGTLSIPGVYVGAGDKFPIGAMMNKALTIKTGQTHMQRYMKPLLEKIENGEIDPSFIITHEMSLDDAAKGYELFKYKQDSCIKVVLKPGLYSNGRGTDDAEQ
ncbi:MAG: glutathione-dependent formaldehyde dehydrogenase [Acidobacteriota bacterium]|nr:glutathione-dependent formaldehyde dehydrogenase [Acidobacteriota bacterium]